MPGLPTEVPPVGSTPASVSPNNRDGGGSSVDGPIVTSVALSGTPSDPNQPIEITAPAMAAVTNQRGDGTSVGSPPSASVSAQGASDVNQTVEVGPPQVAGTSVNGGTFSPQSPNTANTTQNNVAGQVYGTGVPRNVFV